MEVASQPLEKKQTQPFPLNSSYRLAMMWSSSVVEYKLHP